MHYYAARRSPLKLSLTPELTQEIPNLFAQRHLRRIVNKPVIEEIFGHNRLRPYCSQVQPVTCWHPLVFLY